MPCAHSRCSVHTVGAVCTQSVPCAHTATQAQSPSQPEGLTQIDLCHFVLASNASKRSIKTLQQQIVLYMSVFCVYIVWLKWCSIFSSPVIFSSTEVMLWVDVQHPFVGPFVLYIMLGHAHLYLSDLQT